MGSIGLPELIIILVIAFLIFGAKRLPEIGSGLGKAIRKFNKGIKGEEEEDKKKMDEGSENKEEK